MIGHRIMECKETVNLMKKCKGCDKKGHLE
jgi:hypothetical protein